MNVEVDVLAKMVERSLAGVYENQNSLKSTENVAALEQKVSKLEAEQKVMMDMILGMQSNLRTVELQLQRIKN